MAPIWPNWRHRGGTERKGACGAVPEAGGVFFTDHVGRLVLATTDAGAVGWSAI